METKITLASVKKIELFSIIIPFEFLPGLLYILGGVFFKPEADYSNSIDISRTESVELRVYINHKYSSELKKEVNDYCKEKGIIFEENKVN